MAICVQHYPTQKVGNVAPACAVVSDYCPSLLKQGNFISVPVESLTFFFRFPFLEGKPTGNEVNLYKPNFIMSEMMTSWLGQLVVQ